MNRPCSACGHCTHVPAHGWYRCDALRLADPAGEFHALPTRTGPCRPEAFHFPPLNREATAVSRAMSPGPVEGYRIAWQTGERVPQDYTQQPCPAWTPK